jgi:hypothetical protein
LVVAASMCICSSIASGVYGAEVKFGIEKLIAVCVYPCPNMLAVVYYDTPKGAKPSMVVRLWKYFTTCMWIGLTKTNNTRRRRTNTSRIKFFLTCSSTNLCSSSLVLFACLSNAELIIDSIIFREGDGSSHTSGVTSGLLKMISVVS